MTALSIVTLLNALVLASAIPDDYIVDLSVDCGKGAETDAAIKIITDLAQLEATCEGCRKDNFVSAKAICAGLTEVEFVTKDGVNYELQVSYPGQGSQTCVFNKKVNAMVFTVKVCIAYGEDQSLIHTHEDHWTITCTFDPNTSGQSNQKRVVEGCIAPAELLSNMGPDSESIFELDAVDVLGNTFTGRDINLGRTMRLQGDATAKGGEQGIRPVACYAIEGEAVYAILRKGCGDGIIFRKDEGFETKGQTTLSPFFPAFRLNFKPTVIFRCKFVSCEENCDGCSCEDERKRRSAGGGKSRAARNLLDLITKLSSQ